jgi:hypothetical protein
MRERKRREGHAWGKGQGRQDARARAGQARSRRGSKSHDTHNRRSETNRETKSETRLIKTHD